MAGYSPTDLSLTPLEVEAGTLCPAVFDYLADKHRLSRSLESAVSRFVHDPRSGEWVGAEPIAAQPDSLASILEEYRGLQITGKLKIGKWTHAATVLLYFATARDKRICVELKLYSYAYEAVFDYAPRSEGGFNEEAKNGLVGLCVGLAVATQTGGFMLRFDDGEIRPLELEEILAKLRRPELTVHGKRPGLVTGVRGEIMPLAEIESVWGKGRHAYEAIGGYSVLDLLWPIED
jgi:hypothetical protein